MEGKTPLEKAIASTPSKPPTGLLSPEEQDYICKGTTVENGTVHVYREFKPMRGSIEYTVYFRSEGRTHRVDVEVYVEDVEGLSPEESAAAEALVVKQEIRDYLRSESLRDTTLFGNG